MEVDKAGPSASAPLEQKRQYNYVVTAFKPAATSHALTASLSLEKDLSLIVARRNSLELFQITPSGLEWKHEVSLFGRVAGMGLLKQKERPDWFYFLTEKNELSVISYNSVEDKLETMSCGNMTEKHGKSVDSVIIHTDPTSRYIVMSLYEGLMKVVPVPNRSFKEDAFTIRIEDINIIDWKFLEMERSSPYMVVLSKGHQERMQVKTYELNAANKELKAGPYGPITVDITAHLIIPIPMPTGGYILVSEASLNYYKGDQQVSASINTVGFTTCYTIIDPTGERIIIGNSQGDVSVILVKIEDMRVVKLEIEGLGKVNPPSTMCYLDSGFVYVGSLLGDSQLIRLHDTKDESDSYLEVVSKYESLGPIVDFAVVELEKGGQSQIITCSGSQETGALKVIQNGIGINELASVDLPSIQGVWSFELPKEDSSSWYLLASFAEQSYLLMMEDNQLQDGNISGFDFTVRTLYGGLVDFNQILQVTENAAQLVDSVTFEAVATWQEPGQKLTLCSANQNHILLVVGGETLVLLEVISRGFKEIMRKTMECEVSCVALDSNPSTSFCAVGLWKGGIVKLLSLKSFDDIHSEEISTETIPRSVIFSTFEGVRYLFCGLGDGRLFTFKIDAEDSFLSERRKVAIGTKPLSLVKFGDEKYPHIFVCSDFPTVASGSNRRINFSNVNLPNISHACSFGSEGQSERVALVVENRLVLGSIDTVQRLHVRTYPIHEMPRRLVYHESSRTLAVGTFSVTHDEDSVEVGSLNIYDIQTFEKVASHKFGDQENFSAISTATFEGTPQYILVGTAIIVPEEDIPKQGYIHVFSSQDKSLEIVCSLPVSGAVYAIDYFQGKIIATINSKISIFEFVYSPEGCSLSHECSTDGHTHSIYLSHRGHFVLVGDLIRSASLFAYKPQEKTLEMIAEDKQSRWSSAVAILDDDTFLISDSFFNLMTLQRNAEATNDDERSRLNVVGQYHIGGMINRIRPGSLSLRLPEEQQYPTMLFGTVDGALGVIASIPERDFKILEQLQTNMRGLVKGFGGLKHDIYRNFCDERSSMNSTGFVDGDFLEGFLSFPPAMAASAVKDLDVSVDEVTRILSELARLH
eukprot:TRINITY_DN9649_c0_g1_i1.p1 TRINITY_DN9649_c0_g1~~TRINITY_DN9649_c0_g1_i1.p1  ORF type:complete len:1095 (+),score=207.57 TRINITY_DN9649_c0_g1_i1:90-3374(+)